MFVQQIIKEIQNQYLFKINNNFCIKYFGDSLNKPAKNFKLLNLKLISNFKSLMLNVSIVIIFTEI